jgi:hypothetical protein
MAAAVSSRCLGALLERASASESIPEFSFPPKMVGRKFSHRPVTSQKQVAAIKTTLTSDGVRHNANPGARALKHILIYT